MAKREVARARIDAELKHNVEALLGKLGVSISEAIRIYFRRATSRACRFNYPPGA